MKKAKAISCGVLVTDGERLLLGRAPLSSKWDIPKGLAEPGESLAAAARRELFEETGLDAPEAELKPLGTFAYLPAKDLALFAWGRAAMPEPATLVCVSCFAWKGRQWPEFDRFGLFTKEEALLKVGKSLAALLAGISLGPLGGASG